MNCYIIRLNREINDYIRNELKCQNTNEIEYESAVLLNVVAIKTTMTKEEIEKFSFVESVQESVVGHFC